MKIKWISLMSAVVSILAVLSTGSASYAADDRTVGTGSVRIAIAPPSNPVTERDLAIKVTITFPKLDLNERLKNTFVLSLKILDKFGDEETWRTVESESCKGECERTIIYPVVQAEVPQEPFLVPLQRKDSVFQAVLTQTTRSEMTDAPPKVVEIESSRMDVVFKPTPAAFVLSIGVSKYERNRAGPAVPNLCFPAADAGAIGDYFSRAAKRQYPPDVEMWQALANLKPKTLVNEQATKKAIVDEFKKIVARATYKDIVILIFTGHGQHSAANPDPLYLIPYDGSLTGNPYMVDEKNVSFRYLLEQFQNGVRLGGAKTLWGFVDTCYSAAAVTKTAFGDQLKQDVVMILASALSWQKAKDSPAVNCPPGAGGRGFFAGILLSALEGRPESGDAIGLIEDQNGVKIVSILKLTDYVAKRMRKETKDQEPILIGQVLGSWALPVAER